MTLKSAITNQYVYNTNIIYNIALFSFISCNNDATLTRHWINHYYDIGFNRNTSLVILQGKKPCKLEELFIGKIKTTYTTIYSSVDKQNAVNKFIKSLPMNSYIMYPDGDEFFTFDNATIQHARNTAIQSTLFEMVPRNNILTCVNDTIINSSFYKKCNKLFEYLGRLAYKITLAPVYMHNKYIKYISSHKIHNIPVYKSTAPIYHYRYNCKTPSMTYRKYKLYRDRVLNPLGYYISKSFPAMITYRKEYKLYKYTNKQWYFNFNC